MEGSAVPATPFWPLALYFGGVLVLVAAMLGLSSLLGQRHRSPQTDTPFESGVKPVGSARIRLDVKFYLVAMFFVVFDLEGAFLFAWAVAAREAGWPGYIEALVFIAVLLAGLVYLWRLGALDWGTLRRRKPRVHDAVARPLPSAPPVGQQALPERR